MPRRRVKLLVAIRANRPNGSPTAILAGRVFEVVREEPAHRTDGPKGVAIDDGFGTIVSLHTSEFEYERIPSPF